MKCNISHKYKFIYAAPERTATRVVAKWLTEYYNMALHHHNDFEGKGYTHSLEWSKQDILKLSKDYTLIISIRNPFTRTISLLNWMKSEGRKLPWSHLELYQLNKYLKGWEGLIEFLPMEYLDTALSTLPFAKPELIGLRTERKSDGYSNKGRWWRLFKQKKFRDEVLRVFEKDFEIFGYSTEYKDAFK